MSAETHVVDRLFSAIAVKGSPVCVGIDPRIGSLPEPYRIIDGPAGEQLQAVETWCRDVLELVAPFVPVVKPQIACFEALPSDDALSGVAVYTAVVKAAREMGLMVIGDIKRGDIGTSAGDYAAAHLGHPDGPDAITINTYFGADGIEPFLSVARETGRGCFALVRTSNPSAAPVQDFQAPDGARFYEHLGRLVADLGQADDLVGTSGYSLLGAVVGATYPDEARRLRQIMPRQLFLVPGYGAQGATAEDCTASFDPDGRGAIVSASRSVIYAHSRPEYAGMDWKDAVRQAARDFAEDLRRVLPRQS